MAKSTSKKSPASSRAKSTAKKTTSKSKSALNKLKTEAANEVGVSLKQGDNGNLTSRQAGSVGGQMVKKMVQSQKSKKS